MFNSCSSEYKMQVLEFVLISPLLDLRGGSEGRRALSQVPGLVNKPWPLSLNDAGCALFLPWV